MEFPKIARVAQGLSIRAICSTSIKYRNDMVQRQIIFGSTPKAFGASPFPSLQWGKVFAVTAKFRLFVEMVVNSPRKMSNHLVAVFSPPLNKRCSHLFDCFGRVLIAFRWPGSLLWRPSSPTFADAYAGFFIVGLSPKWVSVTTESLAFAFGGATSENLMVTR